MNSAGYQYRSCEDIVEALKPLQEKYKCVILLNDELVIIGDRYYIKATATIINEKGDKLSVSARSTRHATTTNPARADNQRRDK
ncbi:ERF family protein [Campylobacter hyointestinalis]|uniref:ERF family protein n=1 Tax=Campylobacter hyointestinalis TaxID=198 RepID=UPI001C66A476|nr:ERF family protein [Campylobacter hyointestinalis]